MTSPIKFGTDGWRALIAEDYTFDNVRICAQATIDWLKSTPGRGWRACHWLRHALRLRAVCSGRRRSCRRESRQSAAHQERNADTGGLDTT